MIEKKDEERSAEELKGNSSYERFRQALSSHDQSAGYYKTMQQQTSTRWLSGHDQSGRYRPKRRDIFLHAGKTFRLIGELITDPRVPLWRKGLFLGSIVALLVVLLFPDALNELVLSTLLPFVGTVFGIPLDAGFDWVAFALAVVSLLRFFPAELVAEHYMQIFR